MAYDEDLAERVRLAMADVPDLIERKMFGGLAFMAGDHMAVASPATSSWSAWGGTAPPPPFGAPTCGAWT
jgi:hypothetical protein